MTIQKMKDAEKITQRLARKNAVKSRKRKINAERRNTWEFQWTYEMIVNRGMQA